MLRRTLAFGWLVVFAACSGSGSTTQAEASHDTAIKAADAGSDAGGDAGLLATCAALRDQWRTDVQSVDKTCNEDMDCTLVGVYWPPKCNGAPDLACDGDPISKSAANLADLTARAQSWYKMCGDLACGSANWCVADCAPSHPRCAQGLCVADFGSCLPMPHAGP